MDKTSTPLTLFTLLFTLSKNDNFFYIFYAFPFLVKKTVIIYPNEETLKKLLTIYEKQTIVLIYFVTDTQSTKSHKPISSSCFNWTTVLALPPAG